MLLSRDPGFLGFRLCFQRSLRLLLRQDINRIALVLFFQRGSALLASSLFLQLSLDRLVSSLIL